MRKALSILLAVVALAVCAKGILPCMVYRYGLSNEQVDDILARHPDAELRITAQDWRGMRYQLHRFGNMTNYIHQIGSTQDCERVLLALDDSITTLRSASNVLARAVRTWEGKYSTATNEMQAANRHWTEIYTIATNSAAIAERRAARADAAKEWLIEQRDKAVLPSTKAIYQAIIDKLEGK